MDACFQPRFSPVGWRLDRDAARYFRAGATEEALQEQNEQLDAALNNMSQASPCSMPSSGSIVCNQRYAEMYGLTPDQVKPGTTVRQILQYRLANGFYQSDDADSFVRQLDQRLPARCRLASRSWRTVASSA